MIFICICCKPSVIKISIIYITSYQSHINISKCIFLLSLCLWMKLRCFFSPQVWATDTVHRACMRPVTFLELVIWSRIELKSSKTKEKSMSCMTPLDSDLLSAPEHLGEVFSHLGGATQAHSPRVVDHTGHSQQRGRPCQSRYYAWTETRERATRLFWTQKCSAWQLKHSFIMKPF